MSSKPAGPAAANPTKSPFDPYRLFFPLGVAYGVVGAGLWIASAVGWLAYPAQLHRMLMIEGFELAFVVGFLLTALPGLTHSERARPVEIAAALVPLVAFGAFALAGATGAAHAAFTTTLLVVALAALRRLPHSSQPPPVELLFVALGLLLGIGGGALLTAEAAGVAPDLPAHFADRLLSLGMVLSLVLGVGGLLVPTFTGMRDPLEIPFIARAHERPPRIALYLALAAGLVAAFALEWARHSLAASIVRAAAGSAALLLVWKLMRLPGRRDLSAWTMWGAGWVVFAGLWMLALLPGRPLLGLHVVFIGGFGLLTVAIGTRVVVAHGRYGLPAEPIVFAPRVAAGLALALLVRIGAEAWPAHAPLALAVAGACWCAAWLLWFKEAAPRIWTVRPAVVPLAGA